MEIKIRRALREELEIVQFFAHELFLSDQSSDGHLDVEWPFTEEGKEFYLARIVGEEALCLLALVDNEPAGFVCGCLVPHELWRPVKRTELENLFVCAAQRSNGIGALLWEEFRKWCLSIGATRITVSVYFRNESARRFYERVGFVPQTVQAEARLDEV
jgi:GNAT superfamily N-acetyltransferase